MKKEWLVLISRTIESEQNKISNYALEYPTGVADNNLRKAEKTLGFKLSTELRALLMEFNGIHEYTITNNGEKIQVGSIIWDLLSIVEWHFSQTIPEKSKLFCFGHSVLGNCFGYLMDNGKPKDNEIWQSDHETKSPNEQIIWRASNLREFITISLVESRWY